MLLSRCLNRRGSPLAWIWGIALGLVAGLSRLAAQDAAPAPPADAPRADPPPAAAPSAAVQPDPRPAAWQHLRYDEVEITKQGEGSFEKGLARLGAQGYSLLLVTSVADTSAAGYHYFKRGPWAGPGERPAIEFKRLDAGDISKQGGDDFNAGLAKLEADGWELVAVTTSAKGGVGYHYFQRPRPAALPEKPADAPQPAPPTESK